MEISSPLACRKTHLFACLGFESLAVARYRTFLQQHPRTLPAPKMLPSPQSKGILEIIRKAGSIIRACCRWNSRLSRAVHTQGITDGLSHRKRNMTGLQYASASRAQWKDIRGHIDDPLLQTLSTLQCINLNHIPTHEKRNLHSPLL